MRKIISSAWDAFANRLSRRPTDEAKKRDDSVINSDLPIIIATQSVTSHTISTQQLLKNYFDFIFAPENRLRITAASLLTMAMTVFSILAPYYFGLIIASLTQNKKEDAHVNNEALISIEAIFNIVLIYSLAPLLSNVRDRILAPVTADRTRELFNRMTSHQLNQVSLGSHVSSTQSDKNYLLQKASSVTQIATPLLTQIAPKFLELIVASTTLSINYGAPMGLGVLTTAALFTIYCAKTTNILIEANEDILKKGRDAWGKMNDAGSRYKVIHDCGKSDGVMKSVHEATQLAAEADIKTTNTASTVASGHVAIANLGMLAMLLFQREKFSSAASFLALFGYLNQFAASIPSLSWAMNSLFVKYPDLKLVFQELAKPSEIINEGRQLLALTHGARIRFDDVEFSYDSKKTPALNHLSLDIEAGQTVAIVSRSGGGKSTLFNLLYRYYEPNSGHLCINDQKISDIDLNELRKNISIVGQNPNLFSGTVFENIIFGADKYSVITDEMIYKLAKDLNLVEFICSLAEKKCEEKSDEDSDEESEETSEEKVVDMASFKKGLEVDVGDEGKKLSGGQQQKVAILRGFIKNAPIRLLDEITASLDPDSRSKIMDGVRKTSSGKTTIIITHNLTDITSVDKIFVLKQGRVIASGTHRELLDTCPLYQKLWRKQNSESAPKLLTSSQSFLGSVQRLEKSVQTTLEAPMFKN